MVLLPGSLPATTPRRPKYPISTLSEIRVSLLALFSPSPIDIVARRSALPKHCIAGRKSPPSSLRPRARALSTNRFRARSLRRVSRSSRTSLTSSLKHSALVRSLATSAQTPRSWLLGLLRTPEAGSPLLRSTFGHILFSLRKRTL